MTTIEDIMVTVAQRFRLQIHDFKGSRRPRAISKPRMIAMYLCRRLTGSSYPEIAQRFGGKDHSTVIHACDVIHSATDPELRSTVDGLVAQLGGDPVDVSRSRTTKKCRIPVPAPRIDAPLERVVSAAIQYFKTSPEILRVAKPNQRTIYMRSVIVYLARDMSLASHAEIRAALGVEIKANTLSEATDRIRKSVDWEVRADIAAIRAAALTDASAGPAAAG